jgi:hypothetical protein
MVLVLGLDQHGFRALINKVLVLPAPVAHAELLRAFFQFVYMRSNCLLSNARSSSLNTSNSSSGMDTRQDKESCVEDMLVLTLLSLTTKCAQTAAVLGMLVGTHWRLCWVHTSSNRAKGRLG